MAVTPDDLNAFHQFAEATLATRGADSLRELFDIWEIEHPSPIVRDQNLTAIRSAIRDMENGDAGRPATKVIEELRSELDDRRDP
jgi:hypothetical protein